jgi:hypothetical protein
VDAAAGSHVLMQLDDREQQVRFLIHDRDAKFPRAFDACWPPRTPRSSLRPSRRPTQTRTRSAGSAQSAANASTGC